MRTSQFHNHVMHFVLWYLLVTAIVFCSCSNNSSLGCKEIERQALLSFKLSLTHPSSQLTSWAGRDCCKWSGIECDEKTGQVIKLNLRNPNADFNCPESCSISHKVNSSLLDLNHLQYLDLSWNDFSGISIPSFFGSFRQLTYLNLSQARFAGLVPYSLGNLSNLHSFDISDNSLSIDNLHWISALSHLQFLDMSTVNLSNASNLLQTINFIPHLFELRLSQCGLAENMLNFISYANLTSLVVLDLSYNTFGGPLPNFLENYTALEYLDLSFNVFNDTNEIDLSQLCNLKILDLSNNRLQGTISRLFGKSSSPCFQDYKLESLDLQLNQLTGHLPNWLGQLKDLKYLYLQDNSLTGPIPLGSLENLSKLEMLSLHTNKLTGRLPNSFGRLKNLTNLDLYDNFFQGPIPSSIGELSSLRELDMSMNQLNETVPDSFGQLLLLENLKLAYNSLEGVMSDVHFAKLSNLKSLDLSSNPLNMKGRSNWVPPFQLQEINLTSCKLGKFPMWLQTQKEFTSLDMSNASIVDSVPEWFFNFSSHLSSTLFLSLSSNYIYGKVPNIFSSMDLQSLVLDLSQNKFEGQLPDFPSSLVDIDLSHNLISGPIPQNIGVMVPYLMTLTLSDNSISGSIPDSLCTVTQLEYLDLSINSLSGSLPECWGSMTYLYVLDVSSNNLSGSIPDPSKGMDLYSLDLSSNNLSGIIPNSIGDLYMLEWLHLSNNKLHGHIPPSIKSCSLLIMLDLGKNRLSGTIPTWLGKDMPNLKFLSVRMNKLNGTIPLTMCDLADLQVMDLSQNKISGTIPRCFGKFRRMKGREIEDTSWYNGNDQSRVVLKGREYEYTKNLALLTSLDLSSNELVGTMPQELTTRSALKALNLSKNQLVGGIPGKIGEMVSLESLDLSENHLSGKIPQSMSDLISLTILNLSHNNFSGRIPTGNQLQSLEHPTSIYGDNPELCGAPLEKTCPGDEPSSPPKGSPPVQKSKDDEFEMTWFYIGMASGHVAGFGGVCCVLFFNKTWRIAYFTFLSDSKDRLLVAIILNVRRLKKKLKKNQG